MIDYSSVLSKTVVGLKKSGIRKFFDLLNDPSMKDVVGLTVGQPDFVTPDHIRAAGIQSIDEGKTSYTGNAGTPELREEISKYLKRRFDLNYDPSQNRRLRQPQQSEHAGSMTDARVLSIDSESGLIVINAGREAKVEVGMPMQVSRGDQAIARAVVTDVRKKVAGLLVQRQLNTGLSIAVGDSVSVTNND